MANKKTSPIRIPSAKAEDQPATRRMLYLVRDQLSQKMEAGFRESRGEILLLKGDVTQLKSDVTQLKSRVREQVSIDASGRVSIEAHANAIVGRRPG